MSAGVAGLHHITALAGDPQANVDFYTRVLGLRFIKRTVNFDDPGTYHFYYGNGTGTPGTIMSFFPWGKGSLRGRIGTGQVSVTSFSVPAASTAYWIERLQALRIPFQGPVERFHESAIELRDPDGIDLELVATEGDPRAGWSNGEIPEENSIRGFHQATLSLEGYERTAGLLTSALGFRPAGEHGARFRFVSGPGGPGTIIDLVCEPDRGRGTTGVGVVHHIAYRAPDGEAQLALRAVIAENGRDVTPVIDRKYFRSIYFREPGGVLFEIATDAPGFTVDETKSELGLRLELPAWLEPHRGEIEGHVAPVTLPRGNNPDVK